MMVHGSLTSLIITQDYYLLAMTEYGILLNYKIIGHSKKYELSSFCKSLLAYNPRKKRRKHCEFQ